MDRLQEILKGLNFTGHTCKPMTEEEMEQFKADSYNSAEGDLNITDGYECNICKNKGMVMKAVKTRFGYWTTVSSDCKCMSVRNNIRRMNRSGLKNIIRDYTFSKFEDSAPWQKTIKEAAMAYAKIPEGWFFIGGQSGSGKTHICTAICREMLLNGQSVKYMLWRDDVIRLKNAVTDADSYAALMKELKQVPVLYIDDLFKTGIGDNGIRQKPTAADVNIAFEILNYRYNDPKLLTIISSECSINDIIDIDEAVGGRIFERAKNAFSLKPDRSRNYRLKGIVEL